MKRTKEKEKRLKRDTIKKWKRNKNAKGCLRWAECIQALSSKVMKNEERKQQAKRNQRKRKKRKTPKTKKRKENKIKRKKWKKRIKREIINKIEKETKMQKA